MVTEVSRNVEKEKAGARTLSVLERHHQMQAKVDKHNIASVTQNKRSPLITELNSSDIKFREEQRHEGDFNGTELGHAKDIKSNSINYNRLMLNPGLYETINLDGK